MSDEIGNPYIIFQKNFKKNKIVSKCPYLLNEIAGENGINLQSLVIKVLIMTNSSEQGGEKMTNDNGKGNQQNKVEEIENKRLRKLLQKAVNAEQAPDSLRGRIRQMIREK